METAQIVKVAVSAAPYSIDKPYDYLVPGPLQGKALPGVRVTVPFGRGNRVSEGIVLTAGEGRKVRGLKAVESVLDDAPVLDEQDIALALWLRQRYFCTMFEAAKSILPAGLWYRLQERWRLAPGLDRTAADALTVGIQRASEVLDTLEAAGGDADIDILRTACGEDVEVTLRALHKAGAVERVTDAKRRIGEKTRRIVELAVNAEDAAALTRLKGRSSPLRYEVVRLLASTGRVSAADVCYFTGASMRTLKNMEKAGIVTFSEEEALRLSPPKQSGEAAPPIVLNDEQEAAFRAITAYIRSGRPEAVLLQGVTGSGKTQVYLRLVQDILEQGKTAIVLVPEIVLTPQMMQRFSSYFGEKVVMLHSSLRMSERYDQWKRIRRGEVRVVLGTRSAIFAPLKDLGLIVLDEEQEGSYRSEMPPRYHTRDVAKYLCARSNATLVLGSATPSVETAWAAETGIYHKAVLEHRYNQKALPETIVADMRQEVRAGNAGAIGTVLQEALEENLRRGEQSILFLNRRGNSRMLLCGECGYVPQCPRCSVALTYHSANGRLMCHYCGHSEWAIDVCPECGGIMKHVGTGTQKVEAELQERFPGVGILRMDADTTAAAGHEALLRRFEQERIPILLGTQMVAKGLDFPNVTLVGVLSADIALYMDDYRAAERTFSLLTQVVGRAGRGGQRGRAVIQTYTPDNDVIACAARQDYAGFYAGEIRMRRLRRYPPFADLFLFTISGMEESVVLRAATDVREQLRALCTAPELAVSQPEVLGPAPAPVFKLDRRYRYRVLLVGKNDKATRERISWLLKAFASDRANRGANIFVDCNGMD